MRAYISRYAQEQLNRRMETYENNRQIMRDLKVTPLRLPYAVYQDVCAELERAIEYKPDGWDVYLQMYTERVPLKGIQSKFEIAGRDEAGKRYPVFKSDVFDMSENFAHPATLKHWCSFKWYPDGVHTWGITKEEALHIEPREVFTRAGYSPPLSKQYYIFIPNVPESEQD